MLPSLDIFHKGNEHGGHRTLKYRWLQKNLDKSMLNQQHRLQHRPCDRPCSVAVSLVFEWTVVRMANRKANPKYLWSAARCWARKRCWEKGAKRRENLPPWCVACTGAESWKTYLKLGRLHFILCTCPPICYLFCFVPKCQIQRQ